MNDQQTEPRSTGQDATIDDAADTEAQLTDAQTTNAGDQALSGPEVSPVTAANDILSKEDSNITSGQSAGAAPEPSLMVEPNSSAIADNGVQTLQDSELLSSATAVPDAAANVTTVQDTLAPLIDLAGHGGPVLLVLAIMSITALTIVLAKLWQFSRLRLNASQPVESALTAWYQGDADAALKTIGDSRQPSARLAAEAITGLRQASARSAPGLALLREELTRSATAQLEQLRSWLRALEVIATLSPLLGLLGTVLGMIEAFRQLASSGSQVDPSVLSGGIWQALLTTAAGLSVAIPVVLLHSWLERRVERCAHRMEDAVTRIFTRPLTESLREPSSTAQQRRTISAVGTAGEAGRDAVVNQP